MSDDLAKTHTPAEVDIPLLKKKEKERKGGGIVVPEAAVQGTAQVAGGAGVGVAKSGVAALFAGKMGVAALALGVGGAGLIGVGVMKQNQAVKMTPRPQLDGLSSSIGVAKRNATGSKSLSFMAKAGQGELRWDDPNKPQPQKAEAKTEEDLADAAGAGGPSQEELMAQFAGGAEGEGAGEKPSLGRIDAKLSTQLGQSSAFGSKSIFSGGTGFDVAQMKNLDKNKLGASPDRTKASAHGKLGALRRTTGALNAKNISTRGVRANRAMGQLKFAGRQSGAAALAGSAGGAASSALGAFEGTKTEGGELAGPGGGEIGADMPTIQPPGSGAPGSGSGAGGSACPSNWTQLEGGGCEPPNLQGTAVTPYQGLLDNAKQMADQAKQLQMAGIALIAIGLIVAIWWPIGWAIVAIGLMMVAIASSMSSQAANMGQQISNQYGQEGQGEIVERYGEDANTANDIHDRDIIKDSTVEQDVEEERNSDYTLQE